MHNKHDQSINIICYECHKLGHIKPWCSLLNVNPIDDRKIKKDVKKKKAYTECKDNASSSSASNNSGKEANLCLLAN